MQKYLIGPLTARNEMSNPSVGMVIDLLRSLSDYEDYFLSAFGGNATLDRVGMALGAYQRTLVGGGSSFDQWYFGKKEHALTSSQKRGFRVFMDKGGCGSCHLVEKTHALFTDNSFHDTGYGWMREQKRQNPPKNKLIQVAPGVEYEISNDQIMSVGEPEKADLGRYEVTEKTEDRWKFRTSSLRNIAKTGPYMHDGGLQSLAEVVEFYNRGGPGHKLQDKRIQPLKLTNEESYLISLIKPQFEVGKGLVGKGGIVRDSILHDKVCNDIEDWVNNQNGWKSFGITPSPILGKSGNKEFLIFAQS